MKKKLVLTAGLLSTVLSLSACSSPERALAQDRATCDRIGFGRDSQEFRGCVLQLQSARLAAPKHHHHR